MQKLNDQKKQYRDKTSNILVGFFVFITVVLCVVRVLIANQTVGASEKLKSLDAQIEKTQTENQILAEDLRQKQSLITIESRAKQAGFTKTDRFSFVTPPDPVAFNTQLSQTP